MPMPPLFRFRLSPFRFFRYFHFAAAFIDDAAHFRFSPTGH